MACEPRDSGESAGITATTASLKRSRSSEAAQPGRSIQDCLKSIGKRTAMLQQQFESDLGTMPETFHCALWSLLLEVRPFLFLRSASALASCSLPDSVLQYHTGEPHRDLNHARLALRLYVAILRMTVAVPAAALHCLLTLLSLMPVFADVEQSAWPHTERYLDGVLFAMRALHASDPAALREVLLALLQPSAATTGNVLSFVHASSVPLVRFCPGRCVIELDRAVPQAALGAVTATASWQAGASTTAAASVTEGLFRGVICASSTYEMVCAAYGLAWLLAQLMRLDVTTSTMQTTVAQRTMMVELACNLLTVSTFPTAPQDVASPGSPLAPPRQRHRGEEDGFTASPVVVSPSERLHAACGALLLALLYEEKGLVPAVHGVLLLRALLRSWHARALSALSPWEVRLLRWLAASSAELGGAFVRPLFLRDAEEEDRYLECTMQLVLAWTEAALRRDEAADDMSCDVVVHNEALEVIELVVRLVEDGVLSKASCIADTPTVARLATAAERICVPEHLPSLLALRAPVAYWLRHPDRPSSITRRLLGLLPPDLVQPALRRVVNDETEGDTVWHAVTPSLRLVMEANALACLAERATLPHIYADRAERLLNRALTMLRQVGNDAEGFAQKNAARVLEAVLLLFHYALLPRPAVSALAVLCQLRQSVAESSGLEAKCLTHISHPLCTLLFAELTAQLVFDDDDDGAQDQNMWKATRVQLFTPVGVDSDAMAARRHDLARCSGWARGLQVRLRGVDTALAACSRQKGTATRLCVADEGGERTDEQGEPTVKLHQMWLTLRDELHLLLTRCTELVMASVTASTPCNGNTVADGSTSLSPSLVWLVEAMTRVQLDVLRVTALLRRADKSCAPQTTALQPRARANVDDEKDSGRRSGREGSAARRKEGGRTSRSERRGSVVRGGGVSRASRTLAKPSVAVSPDVDDDTFNATQKQALRALCSLVEHLHSTSLRPKESYKDGDEAHEGASSENASLCDAALQWLCTLAACLPQCDAADTLLHTALVEHDATSVLEGFGAMAVHHLLCARTPAMSRDSDAAYYSFLAWPAPTPPLRNSWLLAPNSQAAATDQPAAMLDEASVVRRLRLMMSVFSGRWRDLVAVVDATDGGGDDDDSDRWPHNCLMEGEDGDTAAAWWHEARTLMTLCFGVWDMPAAFVSAELKATSVETVHEMTVALDWSVHELCRHDPSIVGSAFLVALCELDEVEVRQLLVRSLDVLLAPCILNTQGTLSEPVSTSPLLPGDTASTETVAAHDMSGGYIARLHYLQTTVGTSELRTLGFAPAVAYVLYHQTKGTSSAEDTLSRLHRVLDFFDYAVDAVPELVNHAFASLVLHLLSLEADAQLVAATADEGQSAARQLVTLHAQRGSDTERQVVSQEGQAPAVMSPEAAFACFTLGVQVVVSLSECEASGDGVLRALRHPVPVAMASQSVVKSVFDILDRVSQLVDLKSLQELRRMTRQGTTRRGAPAPSLTTTHPSPLTVRRWLLGLASFLRFMGGYTTLVAAKLPAMLEACGALRRDGVVDAVCVVWRTLVYNCSTEYLQEHAAAIVVDLVSLELDGGLTPRSLALLHETVTRLHEKTPQATFWQSYFRVLAQASALVLRLSEAVDPTVLLPQPPLQQQQGGSGKANLGQGTTALPPTQRTRGAARRSAKAAAAPSAAAITAEDGRSDAAATAEVIVSGFLSVMQSSSSKCRAVFVRSLYTYLHSATPAVRLAMTLVAATTAPTFLPTLLRCTRELGEADARAALRCIGIIGAVAPRPAPPLSSPHDVEDGGTGAEQRYYLDLDLVFNWRAMARTLLEVYCPRALGNTADPVMHDRAAYAVQELLRVFANRERRETNGLTLRDNQVLNLDELERYTWWTELHPKTRQVLAGFTTTTYTTLVVQQSERHSPEYAPGMRYQNWLFAFFRHLASRCGEGFGEVVMSLRNVAKRSNALTVFLLPYMIVHLLMYGDEADCAVVLTELETLFSVATCGTLQGGRALSLHSQTVLDASPTRVVPHAVDEHVQLLLHILEDVEHLRWQALRGARRPREAAGGDGARYREDVCMRLVERLTHLIDGVPWHRRALAAMTVGNESRALRIVEAQRRLPKVADVIEVLPLQRIFASLDDRDSARSIHRLSRGLSLSETAFSLENNGDWQQALQNCELVLQHEPGSVEHQLTSLHCMHKLGQLHLMSRYAAAVLAPSAASRTTTCPAPDAATLATVQNYANEAAWRLGEWDQVRCDDTLPVSVAPPLVAWQRVFATTPERRTVVGNVASSSSTASMYASPSMALPPALTAAMAAQRDKLLPLIRAVCREGYAQSHPYVTLLHALADIELVAEHLLRVRGSATTTAHESRTTNSVAADTLAQDTIAHTLTQRMQYTDFTLEAREPLLSLHRALYRALGMRREAAETRLQHAELLRNAGLREAALSAVRQVDYEGDASEHPTYYSLVAELMHDLYTPMQAIDFAQEHFHNGSLGAEVRSGLQVLITNWTLEIGSKHPKEVIAAYELALDLHASESAHHHLALFYDRLYTIHRDNTEVVRRTAQGREPATVGQCNAEMVLWTRSYALNAVKHFGQALLLGTDTVSVSLPRMLTLWLDSTAMLATLMNPNGAQCVAAAGPTPLTSVSTSPAGTGGTEAVHAERVLRRMNAMVENLVLGCNNGPHIAAHVTVTALPQLLSRLGHRGAEVVTLVTRIVVDLLTHFPQPCLWMVLPIAFSKQTEREQVAKQRILAPFAGQDKTYMACLEQAFAVFTALIELCNCPAATLAQGGGGGGSGNTSNGGGGANHRLTRQPFIQRIAGKLAETRFILPIMATLAPDLVAATRGEAVFQAAPTFGRFDDRVEIMSSLQKPKRIWVHSNEGGLYSFLCKAKDEPRKDIRMMEIASLMNTLFRSNPDARRKRFSLRRYSIAALTDDCAIIEWVNEISTLRNVVNQCYTLDGTGVRLSRVKEWQAMVESKTMTKLQLFTEHILPAAPPVLHQWFGLTFLDNQAWYDARTLFTQSTALWSIVGHIVGLGDRHGDNLMVDLTRGEVMHVDFACMFDKGETLEVPERVRFRLTQNLVDGMGVLGVDGPFRANCEVTLRCLMKNKNAVMSVVETLLHDPLVEWVSRSTRRRAVNPKSLIDRVSRRLDGFLDLYSVPQEQDTLALNVEGQVTKLISHASALENLSEMYIWWMAWV